MEHWFPPGKFLPREIEKDPFWERASDGFKAYYRFISWHSFLVKRSPTRRYCSWTKGQIAEAIGKSPRQVQRYIQYAKANNLIRRHYEGVSAKKSRDGKAHPPRDEIPASRGMVNWWKRTRKKIRIKAKVRKDRKRIWKRGSGSTRGPEGSQSPGSTPDTRGSPGP